MSTEGALAWRQGRDEHKQAQANLRLSDPEFIDKHNELTGNISNLVTKLSTIQDKNSPEYQDTQQALVQAKVALSDMYHPQKNPGALERLGRLFHIGPKVVTPTAPQRITPTTAQGASGGKVDLGLEQAPAFPASTPVTVTGPKGPPRATQENTVIHNPKGLVEPGNLPIWTRPTVQNEDGSHSSEYSTSFQDNQGREVLVPTVVNGRFLTPDGKKPQEGSPEEKAMFKAAWDHYLKTGENLGKFDNPQDADAYAGVLHNRGAKPTPQILKAWAGQLSGQPSAEQQSVTTTPQDVQVPAGKSAPVELTPTPNAKATPSVGSPQTPGQYAPGTPKELLERAKRLRAAQGEAGMLASAAPESPDATADRQSRLALKGEGAKRDWELEWAKQHGASGPELEEVTQHIEGLPTAKIPKPVGVPYKDANDGKWYQRTQNPIDGSFSQVEVPGYSQTARPSTSAINEIASAYAKAHGTSLEELTPEAWDYIQRKNALDRAIPSSTTTTTLKQDFKGAWVPVTETNYRTPGGNITLTDPMGSTATPASTRAKSPQGKDAPANPSALRKEAEKLAPNRTSSAAHSSAPKGNPNTRVGTPVFTGKNKEYEDQQAAYDGAVKRAKKMHDNLKEALKSPPDQQAMLSLVANHIGMTLGAQKGARINQAVWNEAVSSTPWLAKVEARFDPNSGILSGVALAPEQMKQMVGLADESVKAEKESLDEITKRLEAASGPAQSSGDEGKKHKIKIGNKFYTYKGTGDTADIHNYDEVKQ